MCPFASAECQLCGGAWAIADPLNPGVCPHCEKQEYIRLPCESRPGLGKKGSDGGKCPGTRLDESIEKSAVGDIIHQIQDIEAQQRLRLQLTANDIRADVFVAMEILEKEREVYNKEVERDQALQQNIRQRG